MAPPTYEGQLLLPLLCFQLYRRQNHAYGQHHTRADADYAKIHEGDELAFHGLLEQIKAGNVTVENKTTGDTIALKIELGQRQEKLLLAGGLLTSIKAVVFLPKSYMIELIVMILLYYHLPIILYHGGAIMYFDAHFIFNTFRSRGVFMFVLCLIILCSVRSSFAAEAEATLQAETTDDSAIEAAGIVSEHGQLSVSSSGFVVDKNQSVFQIQGISTHNLAWYPEYVNVDTFRKLRDEFNINTIRLAMYTEDGGYCVSDDTARQQMLACLTSGIEAAIQLDMYVIVDWHILSDSNPNLYKETALSFFERIASTYGDKPNILYEICNEPNGDTSWDEIKSYSVDVIQRYRA